MNLPGPKILWLTTWYPNRYDQVGGIFVQEHVKAAVAAGAEIHVMAFHLIRDHHLFFVEQEKYSEGNRLQVTIWHIHSRFHDLVYHFPRVWFNRLKREWKKTSAWTRFDLIHAQVIHGAGLNAYRLSRQLGIPFILTEHSSKARTFLEKGMHKWEAKRVLDQAAAITVVSPFLASQIQSFVREKDKLIIIPNVVNNVYRFNGAPLPKDKWIFSAVATWQKPKRPDLLIASLHQVAENADRPVELQVIGDGPLLTIMREMNQTGKLKVNFLGRKTKAEIHEIFNQSHFFLHASDYETFSVVVAEALCNGLPCLVSNTGALPSFIQEENGVVCDNDLNEWVAGINKLIAGNFNRSKISMDATDRFNPNTIGNQLVSLYQSILSRK